MLGADRQASVVKPDVPAPRDAAEPGRAAREFWIHHASSQPAAQAVHPNSRWQGYHAWTRRMLQEWTLGRIRAVQPRYRRCVDLGCGYGDWTEQFAALSDEVHACDIAPAFVAQTQARIPRAIVECADLTMYRMPKDVDLVYIGAVLMYLSDADALDVLRRIREVVVPGALVMWRDYCAFNLGRRTVTQKTDYYSVHRRASELRSLAELARFRTVEIRSSPSIYGETMGGRIWQWPLRALWCTLTAPWLRASYTLVLRA